MSRQGSHLKSRINALLGDLTGYQLHRRQSDLALAEAGTAGARKTGPRKTGPRKAGASKTEARKADAAGTDQGPGPDAARAERVPAHFDKDAIELIRKVRPRTMTSPIKLFALIQSVRYAVAAQLPGDIVECGVWRGGSMQAVAWALEATGDTERDLYLFDTFEGMPPPTSHDRRTRDGSTAADLMQRHDTSHPVWAVAGLDDVIEGMAETNYPEQRVHMVKGLVEDTIPTEAPEQIAILRLDTDWYASTRHELEHLYPRLVPGGVLILDDYGHWEGARKATEEYLSSIKDELLLLPMATGRIAVKPG